MTSAPKLVQQILIATDFSDEAEAALRVAVAYARHFGARLHLFHVYSTGELEVTRLLADAASLAHPDVSVIVSSTGGDAAEEILRYAGRHAIDLIVMSTHGRSGVSRFLLGSVADRVLRHAACPVLVVPARSVASGAVPPSDAVEHETSTAERPCLVCATPSRDLVCSPCRARIRGEALEHKRREARPGRA
jgi:nucleotide-binding universal stress UspA family protein